MRADLRLLGVLDWIQRQIPRRRHYAGYSALPESDQEKLDGRGRGGRYGLESLYMSIVVSKPAIDWATHLLRLRFLIPSFIQQKQQQHRPASQRRPSAWLDGLRGVAAFLVVWHHASLLWFSSHIHNGFGSSENDRLFFQWPFIRLAIAGPPQIMVFFIVSGYSISYKPLQLARQARWADLGEALSSSVFRRYLRLFIPLVTVNFFTAILAYWGCFGGEGWGDVADAKRQPPQPGSFAGQMSDWFARTARLVDPLSRDMFRGSSYAYDPNQWTLPIEFDCSLIIFLWLAAFSRVRPHIRMLFTLGLILHTLFRTYWHSTLFLTGMFLCELRFHLEERAPRNTPPTAVLPLTASGPASTATMTLNRSHEPRFIRKVLQTISMMLALYVLSMPELGQGAKNTPGYRTLAALIPDRYTKTPGYFWLPIGAAWLIITIDHAPHLQAIFTGPFPQYLGRISYSLYLVHGPLLWSLGRRLAMLAVSITGRETNELYCFGIFLSACVFWPVAIWLSDLVMRGVDNKAVDCGKFLYGAILMKGKEERRQSGPV